MEATASLASRRAWLGGIVSALLAGLVVSAAWAQDDRVRTWPRRPVRLIVGQNPGSAPDVIARLLAERLTQALGQQVIVENHGGGDGVLGAQSVTRAAPDGYTCLFGTTASVAIDEFTYKSVPYNAERDLAPIAFVGMSPFILAANPQVKAQSVTELIALAKADPAHMAFTSPGPRSLPGMIGDMLNARAGTHIVHVPYNGALGVQDTIAGRTQFTIQGIPAVAAAIQSGRLRPLAVIAPRRLPGMENVPALAETYPGFAYVGWFALFAPAGTQAGILERMNRAVDSIVSDEVVSNRFRSLGIYPEPGWTRSDLQRFLHAERVRWSGLANELHLERH